MKILSIPLLNPKKMILLKKNIIEPRNNAKKCVKGWSMMKKNNAKRIANANFAIRKIKMDTEINICKKIIGVESTIIFIYY